jgi:WD40 repeat protein
VAPNGRWLVAGAAHPNSDFGDFDREARLWDLGAADPTSVRAVLDGHGGPMQEVVFSPDGRWLVTRAADKSARLWRTETASK